MASLSTFLTIGESTYISLTCLAVECVENHKFISNKHILMDLFGVLGNLLVSKRSLVTLGPTILKGHVSMLVTFLVDKTCTSEGNPSSQKRGSNPFGLLLTKCTEIIRVTWATLVEMEGGFEVCFGGVFQELLLSLVQWNLGGCLDSHRSIISLAMDCWTISLENQGVYGLFRDFEDVCTVCELTSACLSMDNFKSDNLFCQSFIRYTSLVLSCSLEGGEHFITTKIQPSAVLPLLKRLWSIPSEMDLRTEEKVLKKALKDSISIAGFIDDLGGDPSVTTLLDEFRGSFQLVYGKYLDTLSQLRTSQYGHELILLQYYLKTCLNSLTEGNASNLDSADDDDDDGAERVSILYFSCDVLQCCFDKLSVMFHESSPCLTEYFELLLSVYRYISTVKIGNVTDRERLGQHEAILSGLSRYLLNEKKAITEEYCMKNKCRREKKIHRLKTSVRQQLEFVNMTASETYKKTLSRWSREIANVQVRNFDKGNRPSMDFPKLFSVLTHTVHAYAPQESLEDIALELLRGNSGVSMIYSPEIAYLLLNCYKCGFRLLHVNDSASSLRHTSRVQELEVSPFGAVLDALVKIPSECTVRQYRNVHSSVINTCHQVATTYCSTLSKERTPLKALGTLHEVVRKAGTNVSVFVSSFSFMYEVLCQKQDSLYDNRNNELAGRVTHSFKQSRFSLGLNLSNLLASFEQHGRKLLDRSSVANTATDGCTGLLKDVNKGKVLDWEVSIVVRLLDMGCVVLYATVVDTISARYDSASTSEMMQWLNRTLSPTLYHTVLLLPCLILRSNADQRNLMLSAIKNMLTIVDLWEALRNVNQSDLLCFMPLLSEEIRNYLGVSLAIFTDLHAKSLETPLKPSSKQWWQDAIDGWGANCHFLDLSETSNRTLWWKKTHTPCYSQARIRFQRTENRALHTNLEKGSELGDSFDLDVSDAGAHVLDGFEEFSELLFSCILLGRCTEVTDYPCSLRVFQEDLLRAGNGETTNRNFKKLERTDYSTASVSVRDYLMVLVDCFPKQKQLMYASELAQTISCEVMIRDKSAILSTLVAAATTRSELTIITETLKQVRQKEWSDCCGFLRALALRWVGIQYDVVQDTLLQDAHLKSIMSSSVINSIRRVFYHLKEYEPEFCLKGEDTVWTLSHGMDPFWILEHGCESEMLGCQLWTLFYDFMMLSCSQALPSQMRVACMKFCLNNLRDLPKEIDVVEALEQEKRPLNELLKKLVTCCGSSSSSILSSICCKLVGSISGFVDLEGIVEVVLRHFNDSFDPTKIPKPDNYKRRILDIGTALQEATNVLKLADDKKIRNYISLLIGVSEQSWDTFEDVLGTVFRMSCSLSYRDQNFAIRLRKKLIKCSGYSSPDEMIFCNAFEVVSKLIDIPWHHWPFCLFGYNSLSVLFTLCPIVVAKSASLMGEFGQLMELFDDSESKVIEDVNCLAKSGNPDEVSGQIVKLWCSMDESNLSSVVASVRMLRRFRYILDNVTILTWKDMGAKKEILSLAVSIWENVERSSSIRFDSLSDCLYQTSPVKLDSFKHLLAESYVTFRSLDGNDMSGQRFETKCRLSSSMLYMLMAVLTSNSWNIEQVRQTISKLEHTNFEITAEALNECGLGILPGSWNADGIATLHATFRRVRILIIFAKASNLRLSSQVKRYTIYFLLEYVSGLCKTDRDASEVLVDLLESVVNELGVDDSNREELLPLLLALMQAHSLFIGYLLHGCILGEGDWFHKDDEEQSATFAGVACSLNRVPSVKFEEHRHFDCFDGIFNNHIELLKRMCKSFRNILKLPEQMNQLKQSEKIVLNYWVQEYSRLWDDISSSILKCIFDSCKLYSANKLCVAAMFREHVISGENNDAQSSNILSFCRHIQRVVFGWIPSQVNMLYFYSATTMLRLLVWCLYDTVTKSIDCEELKRVREICLSEDYLCTINVFQYLCRSEYFTVSLKQVLRKTMIRLQTLYNIAVQFSFSLEDDEERLCSYTSSARQRIAKFIRTCLPFPVNELRNCHPLLWEQAVKLRSFCWLSFVWSDAEILDVCHFHVFVAQTMLELGNGTSNEDFLSTVRCFDSIHFTRILHSKKEADRVSGCSNLGGYTDNLEKCASLLSSPCFQSTNLSSSLSSMSSSILGIDSQLCIFSGKYMQSEQRKGMPWDVSISCIASIMRSSTWEAVSGSPECGKYALFTLLCNCYGSSTTEPLQSLLNSFINSSKSDQVDLMAYIIYNTLIKTCAISYTNFPENVTYPSDVQKLSSIQSSLLMEIFGLNWESNAEIVSCDQGLEIVRGLGELLRTMDPSFKIWWLSVCAELLDLLMWQYFQQRRLKMDTSSEKAPKSVLQPVRRRKRNRSSATPQSMADNGDLVRITYASTIWDTDKSRLLSHTCTVETYFAESNRLESELVPVIEEIGNLFAQEEESVHHFPALVLKLIDTGIVKADSYNLQSREFEAICNISGSSPKRQFTDVLLTDPDFIHGASNVSSSNSSLIERIAKADNNRSMFQNLQFGEAIATQLGIADMDDNLSDWNESEKRFLSSNDLIDDFQQVLLNDINGGNHVKLFQNIVDPAQGHLCALLNDSTEDKGDRSYFATMVDAPALDASCNILSRILEITREDHTSNALTTAHTLYQGLCAASRTKGESFSTYAALQKISQSRSIDSNAAPLHTVYGSICIACRSIFHSLKANFSSRIENGTVVLERLVGTLNTHAECLQNVLKADDLTLQKPVTLPIKVVISALAVSTMQIGNMLLSNGGSPDLNDEFQVRIPEQIKVATTSDCQKLLESLSDSLQHAQGRVATTLNPYQILSTSCDIADNTGIHHVALQCHLRLAQFLDSLCSQLNEHITGSEGVIEKKHRDARRALFNKLKDTREKAVKVRNKRKCSDDEAIKQITNGGNLAEFMQQWRTMKHMVDMDEQAVKAQATTRTHALLSSLQHYICAARYACQCFSSTRTMGIRRAFQVSVIMYRIISLCFHNKTNERLIQLLQQHLREIPRAYWVPVAYQITARYASLPEDTNLTSVKKLLRNILLRLSDKYPCKVLPHVLAMLSDQGDNSLLKRLLKDVSRLSSLHGSIVKAYSIQSQAHEELALLKVPKEDAGKSLPLHIISPTKSQCWTEYFDSSQNHDWMRLTPVLTALNSNDGMESLREALDVDLDFTCDRFTKWLRASTLLPIPSTTTSSVALQHDVCIPCPTISKYSPCYEVSVNGITAPKVLKCFGSDGRQYKQLLKYDDTRTDAVIQQLFSAVNVLLSDSPECAKRDLRIRTYSVHPFSGKSGILEWVNNTEPIAQWLCSNKEDSAHARYRPNDWSIEHTRKLLRKAGEEWQKGKEDSRQDVSYMMADCS